MLRNTFFLAALACLALVSCASKVDMPKGTRGDYSSARLIERDPDIKVTDSTEREVYGIIQNSIAKTFTSRGMKFGSADSDLVVAFLVIYQEPGMTASYPAYFGYGRDSGEIADIAHIRGSLENKRPDYFRQAGVLIDIIDSKTNELVYRNFAKGDVIRGVSSGTRASRIDQAVQTALAEFFR